MGGGGGGWLGRGGGGQGGSEQRIEVFVKIQKKKLGWGGGEARAMIPLLMYLLESR